MDALKTGHVMSSVIQAGYVRKSSGRFAKPGKIESKRYHKSNEQTNSQTRYYISSLVADAVKINAAIREHWGIEDCLHWTLDVAFGR
jgi:predicted transposase YbfD/YdcC